MTNPVMSSIVRGLIAARPRAPRWPSVLPGVLALLFVGHAFEDDGVRSGALYLGILALSVIQFVRPTVLGWGLLLAPFIAVGIEVARSVHGVPPQDWAPLVVIYVLPVVGLLVGHPWRAAARAQRAGAS